MMYKTINKSSPNYLHNRFEYVEDKHQITCNTHDLPQIETCLYLSFLLRQDEGLSSTGEYMLGTVYLGTLDTIA